MDTIIVPVDGATNMKLDVYDFRSLTPIQSSAAETPVTEIGGLAYNRTGAELRWFDDIIRDLPQSAARPRVVAPVARGASGGLVGHDGTLVEVPGEEVTLSYTQDYPEKVDAAFRELAGDESVFFTETGSIRDFPGSLTLIKRFLFEEMERPAVLGEAAFFGTYGILMTGHFLGGDYRRAVGVAGNEHSYWMCHSGARNINESPGTPSSVAASIESFDRLVPRNPFLPYKPVGTMPADQAKALHLQSEPIVTPGGHDTCLSHIPIMSTFHQAFRGKPGTPVIHVEAGTWTMIAQIGGRMSLPPDGYRRDIIVQGTVDGQPVVTARYGGGNDFRYVGKLCEDRIGGFGGDPDEGLLAQVVSAADCFVLPNICPANHLSGPFPRLRGRILNESAFFESPAKAHIVTDLTTAIATAVQVEALSKDSAIPLVITAGGARDPYFGRMLATLTGRDVFALFDCEGNPVSETTSLGAAITGKAACLGVHPYMVDVSGICLSYRKLEPFGGDIPERLPRYRARLMEEIGKAAGGGPP